VRTLVTGAAGFIGSHVVRALLDEGHSVRALHLPTDDLRNLRGLDVERVAGDVTDRAALRAAMRGTDWVFHLAAIYALWRRDPARMRLVNVEGTRRVFEVAEELGCARVVYTSSIARFGGQGRGRRATEASPFRLGPTGDVYSQSKADAHEVAVAASRRIDVTIVAPTGPLGPGDVGPTPTGRLLLASLTLPVTVVVRTVTNFADVRDMARAHVLAATRGQRGETYLLGHQDVELVELARRMQALAGVDRPIFVAPFVAARTFAQAALFCANRVGKAPLITPAAVAIAELGLAADCTKAARELGMPSRPLDDTLRDALSWFAREGYLRPARGRLRFA
jgi:dihydroflavonol-4-reductase